MKATQNDASLKAQTIEGIRPLDNAELNSVSGGFVWILPVVGGFAAGTGIRMGIDWALKKIF